MLGILDFFASFDVTTYASGIAMGVVLSQNTHPHGATISLEDTFSFLRICRAYKGYCHKPFRHQHNISGLPRFWDLIMRYIILLDEPMLWLTLSLSRPEEP